MGYLKISNLYKDQTILLFKECWALEKIHGTSSHISFNGKEVSFFSGGASHPQFVALFDAEALKQKFLEKVGEMKCTVFGEAYGGKMQGMSKTYGPDLKFIAFDVKIDDSWLDVPNAENVVKSLGLEFVHYVRLPTDVASLDFERDTPSVQALRNGMGEGHPREGVVLRPLIEVTLNNGSRVIAKHKGEKFAERQHTPKVSEDKLKVMEDTKAAAEEWVVPMRLEHVLQKLPEATGMEHTPLVVRAMIADVYTEAKGEIVESPDLSRAIGKKTAELWKRRFTEALKNA